MNFRNIVMKLNVGDNTVSKLTNISPIKQNSGVDIEWLYAPYGTNVALVKFFPEKFFGLTGVNPIPSLKMFQEVDEEVIAAIVPEGEMETGWSLFYYPIGQGISGILKSNGASSYQVSFQELEIDNTDEEYIGEYATVSTVDATVSTELDVQFPDAVEGNYVNVYQTALTDGQYNSWLLVSTTWVNQDELLNGSEESNTVAFTETFKGTAVSNDEFNIGTPSEQALVFNQIYTEIADLWAVVNSLTGGTVDFMLIAEYATDGTATKSVKFARNVGVDGSSKSASDIIAGRFSTIDLGDGSGPGQLTYDATNRVASIDYDNGVTLQIGEENYIHAVNKSGSNLLELAPASITGATGETPQFELATNLDDDLSHKTFGILTEPIDNNAKGKLTTFGLVRDVDTSSWSEGDFLYVGAGVLTNVEPTKPLPKVEVGVVLVSNANNGVILVVVEKAHKLGYLSDVSTAGSVEGDIIRKNASDVFEAVDPENYLLSRQVQNGALKETFDFRYNASTSLFELDNPTGTSLTQQFSDGDTVMDTSTPITIAPTFGADANTQVKNYFYILISNKGVITKSTAGLEHYKIKIIITTKKGYT